MKGGPSRPAGRVLGVCLALALYAGLTAALYRGFSGVAPPAAAVQWVGAGSPALRPVAVVEGEFLVDGEPFYLRAVGWDPTRPGELPWNREVRLEEVEDDFRRIRASGFNTVRSWAPLKQEELALAERYGLRVLQGIWISPDAAFADPGVRRRILREVAGAVEASRWSPAIIGYLVMNEPRAAAVARAGLEQTRAFLREVAATVRALDPSAPVGYASWPGLEGLDDELLDFVAFNLYPHRPRVVMDELGLAGYAAMVRREIARGRPLLITEFGVSVSPLPAPGVAGRGGATEAQQAKELVALAQVFEGAGVRGTTVFQWSDGWWKNADEEGDEQTHDPADPEEWFGLVRFEDLTDRKGTDRPALGAFAAHQRAVLVSPENGPASPRSTVRVSSELPVRIHARLIGGDRFELPVFREGRRWSRAELELPASGLHEVELEISDAATGALLSRPRRLLRVEGVRRPLALSFRHQEVRPKGRFEVQLQSSVGTSLTVAAFTEDRYNEQIQRVRTDRKGRARVRFEAPAYRTN